MSRIDCCQQVTESSVTTNSNTTKAAAKLPLEAGGWQSASHAAIKPVLSNGTAQTEAGANLFWCFTSRWRQPRLVHALFFFFKPQPGGRLSIRHHFCVLSRS
ncbi:hypothetical protein PoB_005504700 [Plakobranchus ocellatus]|uniref:Uncharacterized protein n=1 Tax=Plakobranchus ocellatus TaxID=259542 RepID=A0AAV4CAG1_9GAST|nr:hypothetical protein PoB_005504700 [Plakobranchus ocellatus]